MEYKFSRALSVKAQADGAWYVEGLASPFGPPADSQGDIIAKGAYAATLRERKTKLLLEHEHPIGVELSLQETEAGLWGRWSISQTDRGREAHQLALDGVLDGLSIGFLPVAADFLGDGTRVIKQADLYEVSLVALPAAERARVAEAKTRRGLPATHPHAALERRLATEFGIALDSAPRPIKRLALLYRLAQAGVFDAEMPRHLKRRALEVQCRRAGVLV
jgi:HK97 family phage prohead protease